MTRVLHRPRVDEAEPAAHLSGSNRDRHIDFSDVDFDSPVGMPEGWQPARGADKLNHRAVADEIAKLRAESAPIPPTALRQAFDRPAPTWLPAIGLRTVPMLGLAAAGGAVHDATDAANAVLDDIATALDELAALIGGAL